MALCLVAMLAAHAVLTVRQNRIWRDNRTLYEDGVRTQPFSYKCWNNLGLLCLHEGDDKRGLDCLRRALELAPNAFELLARMGWYHVRHGDDDRAIALFERAAANRWRTESFTLWVRAQIYQRIGRLDRAVALYGETLEINPRHQVSLVNLTGIHADRDSGRFHDLAKAYEYAKRAASLPAPQPNAVVALADVCLKTGRLDEAKRAAVRGLKLLDAYRNKARQLGRLEQQAAMYDALERALRDILQTIAREGASPTTAP